MVICFACDNARCDSAMGCTVSSACTQTSLRMRWGKYIHKQTFTYIRGSTGPDGARHEHRAQETQHRLCFPVARACKVCTFVSPHVVHASMVRAFLCKTVSVRMVCARLSSTVSDHDVLLSMSHTPTTFNACRAWYLWLRTDAFAACIHPRVASARMVTSVLQL